MGSNVSNINGNNFDVNTDFSKFGNHTTQNSVTKLDNPFNSFGFNNFNQTNIASSKTIDYNVEKVEEVDVFDEAKEFFSDIYKRIFDRENYNIEQLKCDDNTKEELKKQNEIIESLNKQIDEMEGQIKAQQHIIDSAQKSSLSVNDPNYSIAGTSFSLEDVTTATNKLNDLNQQLIALKQTKMTVCSYYYQNYHLAELQPYDNLLNSEVFKNYTLNEQTETEVKNLVGNDFNYLTEEQYKILNYLYQTSGKNEAKDYYKLLESDLNNLKGMEEAYDMLQKLTVNIDEEYLNEASKEYGIDKEYLKGLAFADLMDTQKFLEKLKQKYPNLTDEELTEFIASMQKNAKVDDLSLETVANYLGVGAKGFKDGVDTFASGLLNCFDDGRVMSQNEYASQYILTALSSVDTHLDDAYQISTSIGNMVVPSAVAVAATMATNGLGAGASAEMIGGLASKVLFFSSTFGNAKHEKLVSGSDKKTALQSAFLNATSEVCLEYVLGTIPGLGRESNSIIKNLFGEGFEEFIQEYYSSGVDAYLYGTEINFDELNENARKSFIYGCLTSYIMNGAQKTINFTVNGVTKTLNASQIQEVLNEDGSINEEKLDSITKPVNHVENNSIEVLDTNTKLNSNVDATENTTNNQNVNVLENSVSENRLNMDFKKGKDANGGNQMFYTDILKKVFKTKKDRAILAKAESIIKENNPDFSSSDVNNMIQNFNQNGCSYIAAANIILEQVGYNKDTLINLFGENIIGVDGNVDINSLALDLYSYMDGKQKINITSYETITANSPIEAAQEILGKSFASSSDAFLALFNAGWKIDGTTYTNTKNSKTETVFASLEDVAYRISGEEVSDISMKNLQRLGEKNEIGISGFENQPGAKMTYAEGMQSWINSFLESKGYNIECSETIEISSKNLEQYIKDGYSIKVCAKFQSPISMTDGSLLGYTTLGDKYGHAMTLKGIDSNGNLIVSSWGKLFIINEAYADSLDYTAVKMTNNGKTDSKVTSDEFSKEISKHNEKLNRYKSNLDSAGPDQTKNYFIEKINDKTNNSEDFASFLEELRTLTNENLPKEFSTIEEYKSTFISELINSGKLELLKPNDVFELTKDPIMFKELIGTEKLNNLFIKNLDNDSLAKLLLASLKNLDIDTLNEFFSDSTMANYINNMTESEFIGFLLNFDSNSNWMFSESIVNRISEMSTGGFYKLLENYSFSWSISQNLNENNIFYYENLLKIVDSKFYNEELSTNLNYSNLIANILPVGACGSDDLNNIVHKIENTRNLMNRKIIDSILDNTDIQMKDYGGQLVIPAEKNAYYDLVYEINGETKTKEFTTKFSNDITLDNFLANYEFSKAALEGSLKIKALEKNDLKTALYLTESNGINEGLNQINLIVDGEFKSIVKKGSFSNKVDLNYMFNPKNSVVIDSIKSIPSFNTMVDSDGIYSIQYIKEGKTIDKYIRSEDKNLNIDSLILRYNLTDFDNPSISKLSMENIRENLTNINEFSASKDIFSSNKYGGNQSDVPSLLNNKFSNADMNYIDSKKANDLNSIIDKYFPNASEIEKVNIAEKYANGGCCYMAFANAFATYMGSIENGNTIFKEKFGYDLYYKDSDTISYNVESLALEMCLKYYSKEMKGNVSDFINQHSSVGVSGVDFNDKVVSFFEDYGISTDIYDSAEYISGVASEDLLTATLNHKNYFNVLRSNHFDLKQLSNSIQKNSTDAALANAQSNGDFIKDIGGHAMLITDFDANFEPIVSSWSKKCRFINDSVIKNESKGAYSSIYSIKFSLD